MIFDKFIYSSHCISNMNFFQNLKHKMIYSDSIKDYSLNIEVFNNELKETEQQIYILREKLVAHDHIKEEVAQFKILINDLQKKVELIIKNQKQSYDNISQDLDRISKKYEQTLNTINMLQQEYHELQYSIQTKTSKGLKIIDNIKNLKVMKLKAIKHNNELQNTIDKEQVICY